MTQRVRSKKRDILVTSALPYATAPSTWAICWNTSRPIYGTRYQKLRGHTCYYVCADDAHGTAIMLRAEREGIYPEPVD